MANPDTREKNSIPTGNAQKTVPHVMADVMANRPPAAARRKRTTRTDHTNPREGNVLQERLTEVNKRSAEAREDARRPPEHDARPRIRGNNAPRQAAGRCEQGAA